MRNKLKFKSKISLTTTQCMSTLKNTDGINTRPTTTNKEYQGSKVSNAKISNEGNCQAKNLFQKYVK